MAIISKTDMIHEASAKFSQKQYEKAEILPPDTYPGRLIRIVDLGTHRDTDTKGNPAFVKTKIMGLDGKETEVPKLDKNGNKIPKFSRRVLLTLEIPGELISLPGSSSDGKPYTLIKELTFSLNEQSTLYKMVKAIKGDNFDVNNFNYTSLLGVAVSVEYGRSLNGKGKVVSITKAAKGMVVGDSINDMYVFSLNPRLFDEDIFNLISKHFRNKIRMSPEYAALNLGEQPIQAQEEDESIPIMEVQQQEDLPWA